MLPWMSGNRLRKCGSTSLTAAARSTVFAAAAPSESFTQIPGEEPVEATPPMAGRIASTWTGLSLGEARVESINDADQWTVQGALRKVRPLWKYSWPNGEQVYISGVSGEVVQYTTTQSRFWAY